MASSNFVPIIEPVKETLNGLEKTLDVICEAGGKAIVIVNPLYGDHSGDGQSISQLLKNKFFQSKNISAGILLHDKISVQSALQYLDEHKYHSPSLIHSGFSEPRILSENIRTTIDKHIFLEQHCGKLYRKHFQHSERVLIRDGFKKRRNADYPEMEEFSDLHITYTEEDMNGFGDFLIVGDDYTEGGGPAYAVAIHITFIDPHKDDVMYIYHFVSTTKDTPTDPAGKFGQALDKLINKLENTDSHIYETRAIKEYRELHKKGHFPGLGTVKKLSMMHHIETLSIYLR